MTPCSMVIVCTVCGTRWLPTFRKANAHALAEERSDDSQQHVVGLPNGGGK
jgi:hypothetical protein